MTWFFSLLVHLLIKVEGFMQQLTKDQNKMVAGGCNDENCPNKKKHTEETTPQVEVPALEDPLKSAADQQLK